MVDMERRCFMIGVMFCGLGFVVYVLLGFIGYIGYDCMKYKKLVFSFGVRMWKN